MPRSPRNRRRLLLLLPVAAVALSLAACAAQASAENSSQAAGGPAGSPRASTVPGGTPISVVASTDVWGDIASTIGGDQVSVTSIITNPDADPHEYEVTPRNQLALARAKIVIVNGGGYDDFMNRMIKSAGTGSATVLNAVSISGKTATGGAELNEHVWYDFPTVEKVIDRLEAAYSAIDPQDSAFFRGNADALTGSVKNLQRQEADLRDRYHGEPVAITEPVPLYMLEAIGLKNETPAAFSRAIEEDSDVPARVLDQTLQLYSGHRVKLLVYNKQTSGPDTQQMLAAARLNHIPIVPVTETLPAGDNYVQWMSDNLGAIKSALSS